MPHSPEHVVEDPAVVDPGVTAPQQDRETLLETFGRNPLEGLGATAGMFMPNWITGSRPETGLSLSDSLRGMIEFTPVVGDVMDLREGMNFENDMDPLERGLAFFAGAGLFGGAAATISMGAQSHMRNRYHQQAEEAYERLAATYRTPTAGMAPAVVSDRPTIDMKNKVTLDTLRESVDQVRARLVAAQATTGIEQEKLAFTRGDISAPRHVGVATARSTEQLIDALFDSPKTQAATLGSVTGNEVWAQTPGLGGGGPRATFAAFLVESHLWETVNDVGHMLEELDLLHRRILEVPVEAPVVAQIDGETATEQDDGNGEGVPGQRDDVDGDEQDHRHRLNRRGEVILQLGQDGRVLGESTVDLRTADLIQHDQFGVPDLVSDPVSGLFEDIFQGTCRTIEGVAETVDVQHERHAEHGEVTEVQIVDFDSVSGGVDDGQDRCAGDARRGRREHDVASQPWGRPAHQELDELRVHPATPRERRRLA